MTNRLRSALRDAAKSVRSRECLRGVDGIRSVFLVALLLAIPVFAVADETRAANEEAAFVVGYATAVLEQSHGLKDFTAVYGDKKLRVDFVRVPETPLDTIERLLLRIETVDQVELFVAGSLVLRSILEPGTATSGVVDGEEGDSAQALPDARSSDSARAGSGYDVLSANEMFEPLMADPRWPHFSASHLWYLDDNEIERVGSANFGESFALVRSPDRDWGQWEVGLQAGVFSVFDLESDSNDLVNSDFLVGLTAAHHYGDFTWLLRVYHQSSHLGDEFLLRNRVDRINLSFEVVDLLVSFDPWQWLRLYAGGGIIVHSETSLDRGLAQFGVEFESSRAFVYGYIRPVAGSDLQMRQESNWKVDASIRAGVQLEHPFLRRTRLRVLVEYYSGRSPNGQFYERRIKTLGLGLHLNF